MTTNPCSAPRRHWRDGSGERKIHCSAVIHYPPPPPWPFPFLRALKLVQFSSERDQAFYGVVAALNARPQVLLENNSLIEQFVLSCASWDRPPGLPQVQQELHNILMAIRVSQSADGQSENPAWGRLLSRMESNTVRRMCDIFQLPRSAL
jgi:hypothetical protein